MPGQIATAGRRTARFGRMRAAILDIASAEINLNGTRGLTLTAVARALGLDTSSVTYYFRVKDELAAACLQRTVDHLLKLATAAAEQPDPRGRVRAFLVDIFETYRTQQDGSAPRLANLADLSALEDPVRAELDAGYARLFAGVRGFFDEPGRLHGRSRTAIAAHVLLETSLWMSAWIDEYQPSDLARIAVRLEQVLMDGIKPEASEAPLSLEPPIQTDPHDPQSRFLHAATNLINRIGYRGASVERISAELGVSVGSFYHHLNGKDELVLACFDRSFRVMEGAQIQAASHAGSGAQRLWALVAILLMFQFGAESPLLRTAAYQSLPPELRARMLRRSRAVTLHISGVIADGIADGSLRAVDPQVAGHAVFGAIHSAASLRPWAAGRALDEAVALYAGTLLGGMGSFPGQSATLQHK